MPWTYHLKHLCTTHFLIHYALSDNRTVKVTPICSTKSSLSLLLNLNVTSIPFSNTHQLTSHNPSHRNKKKILVLHWQFETLNPNPQKMGFCNLSSLGDHPQLVMRPHTTYFDYVSKTSFPLAPLLSIISLCASDAWCNEYSCPTTGLRNPALSPAAIAAVISCFSS